MTDLILNNGMSEQKRRLMEQMLKRRQASEHAVKQLIQPRDKSAIPELSYAQQRLWFLDQLIPGNPAYAFCNIVRMIGKLDVASLEKSFQEIVNRHENLRTSFVLEGEKPEQHIRDHLKIDFPVIRLDNLPEQEREAALQKCAAEEARKPFDMATGPMFRVSLAVISDTQHAVLLTMHHIVYDGWSLAVLFRELKELYEAFSAGRESTLQPLKIQYADYALWQRKEVESGAMQNQRAYWQQQLGGHLPTLQVPSDRQRPNTPGYAGAMHWFYLSRELTTELEMLARREDSTLFMVLLAAFSLLLYRYTGEEDILVGTPIANRNRREIEGLIGFFINSLVMRTSMTGNPDFCQLLERVKSMASDAYANQDYPFEKLVEDLHPDRHIGQNPIFQTMFALQNTPPPPDKIGEMDFSIEEVDSGTAVFDITLSMYENEAGLNGYFEYSTEIFEAATIERMAENFRQLLQSIVDAPELEIQDLEILSGPERDMMLVDWVAAEKDYPRDRCIHELIEQHAHDRPDATAVATRDSRYSYAELNHFANGLAHKLVEHGVGPDDFVGICMERSFEMFASILAVMKAGAAYLPVDPTYPAERIEFMLADTAAKLVITQSEQGASLPDHNAKVISLGRLGTFSDEHQGSGPDVSVSPEHLVYTIYTSGSTGKPKGVLVNHRNLMHSTTVRQAYYETPVSAFLLMSSFSFDSSVAGIFWTLCDGGTLVLPGDGQERDIFQVAGLIHEYSVSHMLSLPSVYSLLLDNAASGQIASLTTVCVAGEECTPHLVDRHFQSMPGVRLYNEYGPTEGTVWSTVYECKPGQDKSGVPIGRAIPNVQIYILDRHLNPVPVGVKGEIYIGGEGITRGYLNRPELTEERFIPDPFSKASNARLYKSGDLGRYRPDGNIDFLGRIDHQVKVRGYRVELGEIEQILSANEKVVESAVIASKNRTGDMRLIAYVEADGIDVATLKQDIGRILPDYMVPSIIIPLQAFPLMPNGKIDRRALPEPADGLVTDDVAYVEPGNPVESVLTRIWTELLERDRVGINDNFFEIGGHSILATRVISRIRENFEVQLPIRHLFDSPTITGIADIMLSDSSQKARLQETAELIMQIDGLSEEELDALIEQKIL